jgi:hypothetical protein
MALKRFNDFGHLLGAGQTKKGVHMIGRATNGYGRRARVPKNTA